MATLRKPSAATQRKISAVYGKLGRSTTAKILGVRPSRLDRLLAGGGRVTPKITARTTQAATHADELSLAQARSRVARTFTSRATGRPAKRTEAKENQALSDLLTTLKLDKKKDETTDAERIRMAKTFDRLGIPASGPGAVYFRRGKNRRRYIVDTRGESIEVRRIA